MLEKRDVNVGEVGLRDGWQNIGRSLDSSLLGTGGCPFALGASGNIVTEDLVFMLGSMGEKTGTDIERLLVVRCLLAEELPEEPLYGFLAEAGLPLDWQAAPGKASPAPEVSAT